MIPSNMQLLTADLDLSDVTSDESRRSQLGHIHSAINTEQN